MNSGQESTADILDSINDLKTSNSSITNYLEIDSACKTTNELTDSKTNTVEHIIKQNINKMEGYLNSKVINIYQRPWSKLETKLKLKKINEYYDLNQPNLDDDCYNLEKNTIPILDEDANLSTKSKSKSKSKKKFVDALNNYKLTEIKQMINSSSKNKLKVEYDVENCKITNISVCM